MEMCYVSLAMITDYDVWQESPVNFEEIIARMKENVEKIKKLLKAVVPEIKDERNCLCKEALKNAKI